MMKKILTISLAVMMIVGMAAGCGFAKNQTSPSPIASASPSASVVSPSGSPTLAAATVNVFQFKVEFKDAFENAAKQFMAANPNVTINVTTVGGGQDYGAALRSKFNSGDEPAIFNIGGPQDVNDWQAKLADMSDTAAAKNALAGLLTGVTVNGKVYGVPYNIEGYGLIYNKSVFSKAGIDPKGIKTFKALQDAVTKLDSDKKNLGIDAVFALPAKETWVTGLHMSNIFISPEFNEDVLATYKAKTIEFRYGTQFKQMLDLQNKYSVQPTASMDYSTQVEKLFSTGKVAMIQQGNWAYPTIEGIDKTFAQTNIGMLPYPVAGYKEDCNPIGVPMYWAVNGTQAPEIQAAAKAFLDWLYLSDAGKKIVVEQFKFIPAYAGYSTDAVSDPLGKDLLAQASAGKTINWVFMGYPSDWGMGKLGADIQLYVQGQLAWDKLISNEKAAWADARK
ncbi:MAG: extracellular solute-binding protein [Clostridia bacterium]|nr:extracellular solute-binding protein [Clostridia bacterium]